MPVLGSVKKLPRIDTQRLRVLKVNCCEDRQAPPFDNVAENVPSVPGKSKQSYDSAGEKFYVRQYSAHDIIVLAYSL